MQSFLRLARALWWIGVVGFRLVWTSFYDDFITLSKPTLSGSTEQVVVALFKLSGWVFAEEGEKAQPFDLQCSARGVLFNLRPPVDGKVFVMNIEERCKELYMYLFMFVLH